MGKQVLTTLCYVQQENCLLMLHRVKKKNDINKDKYIGIGGHMEHGESPEECIQREAMEETGLTLVQPRLRGIITYVIDDYDECAFLYTCSCFSGELKECREGNLEWIKKECVKDLPIWEGDRLMFRLLEEREDVFSLKLVYEHDVLTAAAVDGSPVPTENL